MFTQTRWSIALILCSAAWAAQAQPARLRGTIDKVDGTGLVIRQADGASARLVLTPDVTIIAVVKASIADIKEGTFLGSAAMPQADGSQRALEVHIFPEEMRGTGEGHRPYAPVPQGTMTNGATAGSPVTGIDGSTITVRYKSGEKKIVLPPGVPVVRFAKGTAADLKPGAGFSAAGASRKPDGSYETGRINVGRDGVMPQ